MMSEPSENPIITRLKEFMSFCELSSSQFADYCGIPRPTLSQLLHGRNKSINDQLIKKLHDSFPKLNIVWLLFGKGQMVNDANSDGSANQNASTSDNYSSNPPNNGHERPLDNTLSGPSAPATSREEPVKRSVNEPTQAPDSFNTAAAANSPTSENHLVAALDTVAQANSEKTIKSIIVFYSDNSFETFFPS